MRIGEAASRAGVSPRALRYYEERSLIASQRSPGGQRHYPEAVVDRVRLIQVLYAAGLSSTAVAEVLPCLHTGVPTAAQVALLEAERERLDHRVAELVETRDRLDAVLSTARGVRGGVAPSCAPADSPRLAAVAP